MSSMQEDIQCAGSDTRPPMLDRTDFESWQQRIRLYYLGKDNGENIVRNKSSYDLILPTVLKELVLPAQRGYKGKMLIVVIKDANNCILPVAYAIDDEETNQSWSWFLEQFKYYVAQDRRLCVVSDRNRGIINAMINIEEWKEPMGYHRFCLPTIR
ncbi:MULE transposase domain-containing protein [Tanacetum coccineum]